MEHAKRFRALLADLGLTHPDAAKLLHVSLRTLQNWLSARHQVPYMAFKLVRLLRYAELPGQTWQGWYFSRGMLITPEGHTISGNEGSWWSMLVRQARSFQTMYRRSGEFEQALMELAALANVQRPGDLKTAIQAMAGSAVSRDEGGPGTGGTQRGGWNVPGSEADRAAQPPANLFIAHFRTQENVIGVNPPSAAIKTVAFPSFNFTLQKGGLYGYRFSAA